MSNAKADRLRKFLETKIPPPSIANRFDYSIGPSALQINPLECIISHLSKLPRSLRNCVIREYLLDNPLGYSLTCPHASGAYRATPCLYCFYSNPEVLKIDKLTRYFICKFRFLKQKFSKFIHKNKARHTSEPIKETVESIDQPLSLVNTEEIKSPILTPSDQFPSIPTNPPVHDQIPCLQPTVENPLAVEPLALPNIIENTESFIPNENNEPKLSTPLASNNQPNTPIFKTINNNVDSVPDLCSANDHSQCNGEPMENQVELKALSRYTGINLICPKNDLYQLKDKYIQFVKQQSYSGNIFYDDTHSDTLDEIFYAKYGIRERTTLPDSKFAELQKIYCSGANSFLYWMPKHKNREKTNSVLQQKFILEKRIDHELALYCYLNDHPNATTQELKKLYLEYYPEGTEDYSYLSKRRIRLI
ncbi:unnamed protein product [Rotaria socialis]|nr:unnamed protein product [Rotaria socialis]